MVGDILGEIWVFHIEGLGQNTIYGVGLKSKYCYIIIKEIIKVKKINTIEIWVQKDKM